MARPREHRPTKLRFAMRGGCVPLLLLGIAPWSLGACTDSNCAGDDCVPALDGTTAATTDTTTVGSTSTAGPPASTTDVLDSSSGSTGSSTSSTSTEAESGSTDESGGGSLWCLDGDGDGWGNPEVCRLSLAPIPGYVTNDGDCDDGSASTYPGAAAEERRLCARDEDDDGWGDDAPPAGVDAGSDCDDLHPQTYPGAAQNEPLLCARDDDNDGWGAAEPPDGVDPGVDCDDDDINAFPGAAELEADPTLCLSDADDDGWGEANPGGAVVGGSDCYDGNPDLNPGSLLMTALLTASGEPGMPRTLATVDLVNGLLSSVLVIQDPLGGSPTVNLVSATLDQSGQILANDLIGAQLQALEYAGTCGMGLATLTPLNMPYGVPGYVVCGIEWGPGGVLFGIDHDDDLLTFDPVTGQITSAMSIELGGASLNIDSCGMAYDCANDRLLVMNGIDGRLYGVDAAGIAELLLDLSPVYSGFTPTGLEYDPVSRGVYISTGSELVFGSIDGSNAFAQVGFFSEPVSNLQYLPDCI